MIRTYGFALLFLAATSFTQAALASDLLGFWKTAKGALISISQCGSTLCAQLRSFKPPNGQRQQDVLDLRNHDAGKRNRQVLGLKVLWNIKQTGENKWQAEGYDPRRGYEAEIEIHLLPNNLLKMTGCKKVVLTFCETVTWSKQ